MYSALNRFSIRFRFFVGRAAWNIFLTFCKMSLDLRQKDITIKNLKKKKKKM